MGNSRFAFQEDEEIIVKFGNSENFSVDFQDDGSIDAEVGDVQVVVSTDHRELSHRNDTDQHSISSITGLQDALNSINQQIERHLEDEERHITNDERESWNNKSRVYRNAAGALVISI